MLRKLHIYSFSEDCMIQCLIRVRWFMQEGYTFIRVNKIPACNFKPYTFFSIEKYQMQNKSTHLKFVIWKILRLIYSLVLLRKYLLNYLLFKQRVFNFKFHKRIDFSNVSELAMTCICIVYLNKNEHMFTKGQSLLKQ